MIFVKKVKYKYAKKLYIPRIPLYTKHYLEDGYEENYLGIVKKIKNRKIKEIRIWGWRIYFKKINKNQVNECDTSLINMSNNFKDNYVDEKLNSKEKFDKRLQQMGWKIENKPTLYLHIGNTKTGSSSLQTFFYCHRSWLEKYGILYPAIMNQQIVPWVGNAHILSVKVHNDLTRDKSVGSDIENIAKEIALLSMEHKKNILFSGESFSEIGCSDKVELFCSFFRKYFNIELIIYVRDPLDWYFSRWKQEIKGSAERRNIVTYIREHGNQTPCLFTWIQNVDHVHVISYEEHKKDISTPFLAIIKVPFPYEEEREKSIPVWSLSSYLPAAGIPLQESSKKYLASFDKKVAMMGDENDDIKGFLPLANRTLTDSELQFFLAFNQIPELNYDPVLRWVIYGALLFKKRQQEFSYSKPYPAMAVLAEERHEDFFNALAPYICRERVVVNHSYLYSDDSNLNNARIDPEDVRIALSEIAKYMENK